MEKSVLRPMCPVPVRVLMETYSRARAKEILAMYQLNETEIWREHHREAEGGHLAWRQKVVHPGRKETLPAR